MDPARMSGTATANAVPGPAARAARGSGIRQRSGRQAARCYARCRIEDTSSGMDIDDMGFEGEGLGAGQKRERTVRVARRVFVGNLSWQTSWQTLKDTFSTVGTVRYADVLREPGPGGRSKGCGIVEFETPEAALAAIQTFNHSEVDGRQIFVREDREDYELRLDSMSGSEASYRQGPPKRANRAGASGGSGGGGAVSIGRGVFVGNLPFETTWQELKDHFRAAGLPVVHADILTDPTGASKGCGIVEFDSPAHALRSISLLSNSLLGGRQISVREDREDPALARGGSGRGSAGGSRGDGGGPPPAGNAAAGTTVVVLGLPYRTQWQDLKDLFRQAGNVLRADVMTNPDGSSKGWGMVQFSSPVDAQAAVEMLNGTEYQGRILTVKPDRYAQ